MITRLTRQDAEFYALESSNNPMYVGSLAILDNADGALDYAGLLDIVERRLSLIPRYRYKVKEIPFGLGGPVWVEDAAFDISYHIRRLALPEPGTAAQLSELVARLASRPLDVTQPLWEMYFVEGLADGQCAIFVKSHAALVDGVEALEIGHVILDASGTPRGVAADKWSPDTEPSSIDLALGALGRLAAKPATGLELVGRVATDAADAIGEIAANVGRTAVRSPASTLNVQTSRNRRFCTAQTDLADYRAIRAHFGCSINDAILAVVTGALRGWLFSRGKLLTERTTMRVLVPMSVWAGDDAAEAGEVSSFLIRLPVGEPNPVVRLSQITHANKTNASGVRGVQASTLVHLAGFAPASLHAMSIRSASTFAQHTFNLMITNAPGPQVPMYIGGARMMEMYPVSPLLRNQALSIGLTSYNGKVFYGLNADRGSMADVDVMIGLLDESMEEMLDACA